MRRLHTKVNLIPVIAKADTLTDEEILEFKERVSKSGLYPMHFTTKTRATSDPG